MEKLILYFSFIYFSVSGFAQIEPHNRTIQILPESKLTITGDTNISKFLCDFDSEMIPSTRKVEVSVKDEEIYFQNAILTLNNIGFDCGSKGINRDFHALIQTDEYPEISLQLKALYITDSSMPIADVIISMAGKVKAYKLPVEIINGKNSQYKGNLTLNIHDFNLEPPTKMFGLIVVKENIEINFNLMVEN